jgi:hypothetical protein
MEQTIPIAIGALVIGTLLFRAYMTLGWPYVDVPYPDVIAPAFDLDGEHAEDAIYAEVWLEFITVTALALIGARFVLGRLSN